MDKGEARANHEDLLKRIADMNKREDGMLISESDFHKWNINCTETARLEEQLKKLAKEFSQFEPQVIKAEINHLNALVLTFCSKQDNEKLAAQVAQNKITLNDQSFQIQELLKRIEAVEFDTQEFARFVKGDLAKIWEKLNSLESSLTLLKQQQLKLQQLLAEFKSNSKNSSSIQMPMSNLSLENDEIEKLRSEMLALNASTDKQIKSLEALLDGKIDKRDLDDLERRMFAILEQQINSL